MASMTSGATVLPMSSGVMAAGSDSDTQLSACVTQGKICTSYSAPTPERNSSHA